MDRRRIFFGLVLFAGISGIDSNSGLQAQSASSWNGTWTGLWGGQLATTITIAGNKVTGYTFQGKAVLIAQQTVTDSKISFGAAGYTVTMTRRDANTADGGYVSARGRSAGTTLKRQ